MFPKTVSILAIVVRLYTVDIKPHRQSAEFNRRRSDEIHLHGVYRGIEI